MFLESLSFLKKCEGTVNIKINIFTSFHCWYGLQINRFCMKISKSTEKHWSHSHPDTVKIVPSNTYIFTSDFNSPKSLAQYLSKVASYETLYLSFLKEKDRFSVRSLPLHNYGMCSLCKQLNNNYTRQTPLDINDWYTNQCVSVTDM